MLFSVGIRKQSGQVKPVFTFFVFFCAWKKIFIFSHLFLAIRRGLYYLFARKQRQQPNQNDKNNNQRTAHPHPCERMGIEELVHRW